MLRWIILVGVFLGFGGLFVLQKNSITTKQTSPLSDATATQTPTAFPSTSLSPTAVKGFKLSKLAYRIALYGDSLIDTMVDAPDNVETVLRSTYPQNLFKVYNYGIGAQNVEAGLDRWNNSFSNRGREYPPIANVDADVIIIGSFAFNPFSPHDPEKHKQLLTQLVEKAKKTNARVFMLAEIAPLGDDFGKGPKGVNWTADQAREQSLHIIEQLKNVFAIAKEENVPVIDVFNQSKLPGSEFGRRELVNTDDGIHPSPQGHKLTADTIVSEIHLK